MCDPRDLCAEACHCGTRCDKYSFRQHTKHQCTRCWKRVEGLDEEMSEKLRKSAGMPRIRSFTVVRSREVQQ